jgi:hypothetical protein
MTYHETPLGGWSEPDHMGYGANGYPVRCMRGWGPGTCREFAGAHLRTTAAMTTAHVPLVVTSHTTRAQIQAEIWWLRCAQRGAVIPSTAREWAEQADALLDQLLALEPEPA